MKKILTFLFFFLFLSVLVVRTTSAKDNPKASPFRVKKEAVETQRETVKTKVADKRKENIAKYLQNMVARLRAYVTRLETLITRIESRLTKIAAEDPTKDLTKIKADVDKAKSILADTKDKITDLAGIEDEVVNSTTPKGTFKDIRSKVDSIKKDLQEVHRLLVHVIGDIKGLRVGETKNESQ